MDELADLDVIHGPRRASPAIYDQWLQVLRAANPQFEGSDDPAWIHDDPRLQLCASCGKPFADKPDHGHGIEEVTAENQRRLKERLARAAQRVEENADEASPAICLLRIRYRDGRAFKGIGEVHSGARGVRFAER